MGAEILAQGVAAWAGCKCVKAGQPIGLGYWIGSKKTDITSPRYLSGKFITNSN